MKIDENIFFREATLKICSSLDIGEALKDCVDYLQEYIPITSVYLHLLDPDLNLMRLVAAAHKAGRDAAVRVLHLPAKGMSERAAWLKLDLLETEEVVRVFNYPDDSAGIPEILQLFGMKAETSLMNMLLKLSKGSQIGGLAVFAEGLNQFSPEHVRLLKLLHGPFAIAVSNALIHQEVVRLRDMLADDNRFLFAELRSASGDEIVGSEFGMKSVMGMVRQVAPLASPVLLMGETGTGKEVVANAIHYSSPRRNEPFIKVNCGAIPESLLDSELFGHEKGAFTGAISQKRGRFERADKGTIFLDEIGELPLQAQVRLLRVLQEREIERVGGTEPIRLDIRVVAATHRNLQEMAASGHFREDLWFRLNVFPITIPPLRQRKEDITALVYHFVERKSKELKIAQRPLIATSTIKRLKEYDWPGNIRELENLIERALIQSRDDPTSFERLLAPQMATTHAASPEAEPIHNVLTLDEINTRHIKRALEMAGGKINGQGGAAEILELHPNTLRARMKRLGIPYGKKGRRPPSAG